MFRHWVIPLILDPQLITLLLTRIVLHLRVLLNMSRPKDEKRWGSTHGKSFFFLDSIDLQLQEQEPSAQMAQKAACVWELGHGGCGHFSFQGIIKFMGTSFPLPNMAPTKCCMLNERSYSSRKVLTNRYQ